MTDNTALKACPFCGGEAEYYVGYIQCTKCLANIPYAYGLPYSDGKTKAIAAWNRRAEPANEPLTLAELREVDGEPVYIKYHTCGRWEIYQGFMHDRGLYGKTWLAYRHKTGGGE